MHYHSDFIETIAKTSEVSGIPELPVWPHMLRLRGVHDR